MKPLDLARRAVRFALHLYSLASTPTEYVSLTLFLVMCVLAHIAPWLVARSDAELRLRGTRYAMGPHTTEIFSLDELYYHRDYDKLPAFIPRPSWIVLDIGANVGVYTREQVRRGARVYAVEPNPDCYRRLCRMVRVNGLADRVHALHAALGNTISTAALRVQNGQTTSGALIPADGAPEAASILVDVTTLDTMVSKLEIPRIDLLKIDVEGAEVEVLAGARAMLTRVDRIIVEYHARDLQAQVDALLAHQGFVRRLSVDEDAHAGLGIAYYAGPRADSSEGG